MHAQALIEPPVFLSYPLSTDPLPRFTILPRQEKVPVYLPMAGSFTNGKVWPTWLRIPDVSPNPVLLLSGPYTGSIPVAHVPVSPIRNYLVCPAGKVGVPQCRLLQHIVAIVLVVIRALPRQVGSLACIACILSAACLLVVNRQNILSRP